MIARLSWILLIIQVVSAQTTHSDIAGIHAADGEKKLERLGHGDDSNIENEGGRTYQRMAILGEHNVGISQRGRFQGVQDPEEESMQKKYWWVYTICFAVILGSVVILIQCCCFGELDEEKK